jgi:Protein of unknown function (DUF1214)
MDQDGELRLHLQAEPAATGHEANWLPTSGAHPWFLMLRLDRPATIVGHRRCMGMSSDHPRDLNLNKAPAAECSGRVVEQSERVSDHYCAARLWAARRAAVSSAPVGARPR